MGTPLVRKNADADANLPSSVLNLLSRIASHKSKASDTYYLATYRQYFDDAHKSLRELRRVMRQGGRAVLVLQTSFYKEIPIPLPHLFMDLARTLSFATADVHSFPVQRVLATINAPSRRHVAEKQYTESVIAFEAA